MKPLTVPAADQVMNPPKKTAAPANNAKLPFAVVSANRTEKLFFAFMAILLCLFFYDAYRITAGISFWHPGCVPLLIY
jgi:hypothetical protein